MPFTPDLKAWLYSQGFDDSAHIAPLSGGSINDAFCISCAGRSIFVKQKENAPSGFFEAEAEGLAYLQAACNLPVPAVHRWDRHFIALEYIAAGVQAVDFWPQLGRMLARLHDCTREQFGFVNDNFIGVTAQPNHQTSNGYEFFAQHRLIFQMELAESAGLLSSQDCFDIEKLASQLDKWVPLQPASLLHGDLWSGNIHVASEGTPVFIDPAVYYGWAEADLAMTLLFGGFPESFYAAYREVRPIENAWKERVDIYNLYHLLNHLNMFGSAYYEQVKAILGRFV